MAWAWNDKVHRYYNTDTGRFLSKREALGYVEKSLTASGSVTDMLAGYVADGALAVSDWYTLMAREIKGEYIRQAILGKGGRGQMTLADWGKVGSQIKEQYGYLKEFAEQVAQGTLTEAQIAARSRMYINSAREAFEEMQGRVAQAAGYNEEAWNINPALENCDDCLDYRDMGWQPFGTFPNPGDGSTRCLTNCGCWLEYQNSETGDQFWGAEE